MFFRLLTYGGERIDRAEVPLDLAQCQHLHHYFIGELKKLNNIPPLPETFDDCWGAELTLEVYECKPDLIKDPEYFKKWVSSLVKDIEMVPYGEPHVIHFGKGEPHLAGWTVLQFIETSHISAHFNDLDGSAAINVFSCKPFNPSVVLANIVRWFGPGAITTGFKKRIPKEYSTELQISLDNA